MGWLLDKMRELTFPEKSAGINRWDYVPQLDTYVPNPEKSEDIAQTYLNKVTETAMAPQAGMLKISGLVNLAKRVNRIADLANESSAQAIRKNMHQVLAEAFRVPQREYSRINDIRFQHMGASRGAYNFGPSYSEIQLSPSFALPSTVWHEFAHARTINPDKGFIYPRAGGVNEYVEVKNALDQIGSFREKPPYVAEADMANAVYKLRKKLKDLYDPEYFYENIDPVEHIARTVGNKMPGDPIASHSETYLNSLSTALLRGKQELYDDIMSKDYYGNLEDKPRRFWDVKKDIGPKNLLPDLRYEKSGLGGHFWTDTKTKSTFMTKTTDVDEVEKALMKIRKGYEPK